MRFGILIAVAGLTGASLAGCDQLRWPQEPASAPVAAAPAASCPPTPACAPAKAEAKAEASSTVAATKTVKVKRKARAATRRYVRYESGSGLAGGESYSQRRYARPYGYDRESGAYSERYSRYERDDEGRGRSGRAYSYESQESSSESSRYSSEYEERRYGSSSYAEGGGYGYGYRETYYAAGRDSRGYLVWPGKRD